MRCTKFSEQKCLQSLSEQDKVFAETRAICMDARAIKIAMGDIMGDIGLMAALKAHLSAGVDLHEWVDATETLTTFAQATVTSCSFVLGHS